MELFKIMKKVGSGEWTCVEKNMNQFEAFDFLESRITRNEGTFNKETLTGYYTIEENILVQFKADPQR